MKISQWHSPATCTKQLQRDLPEEGYLAAAMHGALAICDAHAAACRAVVWVKAAYLYAKGLQCFLHRVYKGWLCIVLHAFAYYPACYCSD